jgi:SAM-dependent methyltransferase
MLTRILEPEAMDTPEEAREYDAMDHAAVNRVFVTDFLFAALAAGLNSDAKEADETADDRNFAPGLNSADWLDALDLGTGTAQIPVELCRRSRRWRIMAIDLSIEMLNLARLNVEIAGLRERIHLNRVDGKELPYPPAHFAAVISNSIVHHIPEPRAVLVEAVRVVRPGGVLFVRDLLRPVDDATVRHLVETYAGDATPPQRPMLDASLRAALSLDEIRELVVALGFPADTVEATSDRHWTWSAQRADLHAASR